MEELLTVVLNTDVDKRDYVITVKAMKEPSDNESLYTVLHTISYELSDDEKEWKNVAFARFYGIKGIRMVKEKNEHKEAEHE